MGSTCGISRYVFLGYLSMDYVFYNPLTIESYRSTYVKGWISGVAYNASLPILFLSYAQNQFFPNNSENWALHYGILVGITVVLTFVNYRGLEVVGSVSVLIFFLTMAPFVLLVIIGIPKGKNVMMNWYADNIIHSPRIK